MVVGRVFGKCPETVGFVRPFPKSDRLHEADVAADTVTVTRLRMQAE